MSYQILLLEDDRLFNETLQDFLEEEGYHIVSTMDPYSALDKAYEQKFDLYLFDVNLPYENGFELLHKLRDAGDTTPTIFITSRDDKLSLQEGFTSGGDDYIKKPFDLDELKFRIEALMRRQVRNDRVTLGAFTFDTRNLKLYSGESQIELSNKSLSLLKLFIASQGAVVSMDQIKDTLWATSQEASDGSIRVYVTQLKKIFPQSIQNIRGVGYSFVPPQELKSQ